MVKHFISIVITLFLLSITPVFAQNGTAEKQFGKNEFQISLGLGALNYSKSDCGAFAINQVEHPDCMMSYGCFDFGYMHNFTDHFGFGGTFSIGSGCCDIKTKSLDKEKVGNLFQFNATALASVRYYYIHKEHFGLYSKLGFGIEHHENGVVLKDWYLDKNDIDNEDLKGQSESCFAFNVIPVGVDFGNNKVRGFVDMEIANSRCTFNAGAKFIF